MKTGAYDQMKSVGYHLAKKYRLLKGDLFLQSAQPLLKDRTVKLPPLLSDLKLNIPIEHVIRECYAAYPIDVTYFLAMWDYTASLVKQGGWKPVKPFFEFVSLMFPDLQQPTHTPRGVDSDTRGLLCQTLVIAQHRLPSVKLHVSSDMVGLKIKDQLRAAVTQHAITWREGHYICRSQATPIDFVPWSARPMYGTRTLPAEAAALRLRLMHLMPAIANQVDIVFRCAAFHGTDACQALCEPYDIRITEDTLDQTKAISSMLAAQQQLKAKR
jgi:hypothetical protein